MKPLTPKQQEFLARCIGKAHAAILAGQHPAAATGWCRKALEVVPDLPEAWYNLGLAPCRGRRRAKKTKVALLKAAALAPDIPDAQSNIGLQLRTGSVPCGSGAMPATQRLPWRRALPSRTPTWACCARSRTGSAKR